jgi:arginine transport system substrate-binding protein
MLAFCKKFYSVLLLAVVAICLSFYGLMNHESSEKALIVGLQSGYPPFEFMDSKGTIVGFDVDLASLIARQLDRPLIIREMEFDGLLLSLQQGKIDLIMSGMNITPSRTKEIQMIPYHGESASHLTLIFWGNPADGLYGLEEIATLPKATVSVEAGSVPEVHMSYFPSIQVKSFEGALAPLLDVKYGKSTANLVEPEVAEYLKNAHPEIVLIDVPLLPGEEISGFGIGVKMGNEELFNQVSGVVQNLKESGTLKQLEDLWFGAAK